MSHRKANLVVDRASRIVWTKESDMLVQPYLMFGGRCEEAIEFYRKSIGAEVEMLMRFKDSPDEPPPGMMPPNWGDKVMHASLKLGDTQVMASDGCVTESNFKGFSLALSVTSEADAARKFGTLSEGGKVTMPLTKTFFAKSFGMLTDKFGIDWMLIHPADMAARAA
jgi:PhnB protein